MSKFFFLPHFLIRNEQKKLKQQKPVLKDPKLQDLQAQLEKKKQERLKASKEMKVSPNRQPSARTKNLNKQKVGSFMKQV